MLALEEHDQLCGLCQSKAWPGKKGVGVQEGGRGLAHCQMRRCEQPKDEIKELLRQAKHLPKTA
jgi:hypothetical protein